MTLTGYLMIRIFSGEVKKREDTPIVYLTTYLSNLRNYIAKFNTIQVISQDLSMTQLFFRDPKVLQDDNYHTIILQAAKVGKLDVIRWMHQKHLCQCSRPKDDQNLRFNPINSAAYAGHFHVVKWLHENCGIARLSTDAIERAAIGEHLEILQYLDNNQYALEDALFDVVRYGILDSVKWFHAHYPIYLNYVVREFVEEYDKEWEEDFPYSLDYIKWLYEHYHEHICSNHLLVDKIQALGMSM